eukprot:6923-Heterococcus_DN1.PRE.3
MVPMRLLYPGRCGERAFHHGESTSESCDARCDSATSTSGNARVSASYLDDAASMDRQVEEENEEQYLPTKTTGKRNSNRISKRAPADGNKNGQARKLTHAERKKLKQSNSVTHSNLAAKSPAELIRDHVLDFNVSINAEQFAAELDNVRQLYKANNDGAELLREMNGHAATEFRLTRAMLDLMPSMEHVVGALQARGDVRDVRIHLYDEGEGAPQHRDDLPAGVDVRVFVSISTDTQQQQQQAVNSWRVHCVNADGSTGALLHQHDVPMTNGTGIVMDRLGCGTEHTGSAVIEHIVHLMQEGTCRGTAVFNVMLHDGVTVQKLTAELRAAVPVVATAAVAGKKLVRPVVPKGCWSSRTTDYNNMEVLHKLVDGTVILVKQSSLNGERSTSATSMTRLCCLRSTGAALVHFVVCASSQSVYHSLLQLTTVLYMACFLQRTCLQ